LAAVNRKNLQLLQNIEKKILGNLGMEYEFETIADILFGFAKLNAGSNVLKYKLVILRKNVVNAILRPCIYT